MEKIHQHSAGIDIGARNIYIGIEGEQVAVFGTFTQDFKDAVSYLLSHGIRTVAMEATGSYWIILFDVLQAAGLDVWLVDGRQTRQVPGRKTDVKDCQWINQLHSYGLLNRCFVAEGLVKELRSYQRLREDHIRSAAMHINHMQKALVEMNLRLPQVLSQVQGKSGLSIIEAILAGERNPHALLALCHGSLKNKAEDILKALEGYYTETGLFSLLQAYEAYKFYQGQILACDKKIEEVLSQNQNLPQNKPKRKEKPVRHHKPSVDGMEDHLRLLFDGKDATQLSGITSYTWFQLYTETGNDLSKWETEKHFTSWLGLSPGQNHSGKSRRNKSKGKPKAGQIFRTIGQSLLQSKRIALGEFGRRIRARKGSRIAIKAVARKLAEQYWRLMVKGQDFVEKGVEDYKNRLLAQKKKYFQKLAIELDEKTALMEMSHNQYVI
ncbi:IS110 family transposase [Aquiflexum sp.]|uniref:IS110 family transposase n=1 Tax=Aquiflexum sp. TaxID=1872584 RepID=UPI003593A925